MKAVVLQAPGVVQLQEMPIPVPRDDFLLIQTGAATVCTSDLNDIRSNPFGIPLPVTLGHEGAGTVAAVGRTVIGFQVGDRVATHPVHSCGACGACRDAMAHLCEKMEHFGVNLPGVMAEYYVVRQDRARKIPDSVDFALASLAEPVSVCLEALAQANLKAGNNLLIIGDGPFGLLMSRLAARMDLANIVIAGFSDFRLSFARSTRQVNTRGAADPVRAMLASNEGQPYHAVILAAGSPRAFLDGLKCLRRKGRLVVFASIHEQTPVDLFEVQLKELEIVGAVNDQDRFDQAVQSLPDPGLRLGELITHRLPLEEYQDALRLAEAGMNTALKVSLVIAEQA